MQTSLKSLSFYFPLVLYLVNKSTLSTNLDHLVPAAGDNNGVAAVWRKANTRHPLSVAFILQNQTEGFTGKCNYTSMLTINVMFTIYKHKITIFFPQA